MNPNDRNSNESVRIADEVDENLVQEIPNPHIQMNENEAELHPHYNVAYGHNKWNLLGSILLMPTPPNQLCPRGP